jgi:hypothetical protein
MGRSQANSHFELCSARLPVDGNTTSTNSAKTPMTNQRTSMPFQAFANGIPLALVNVHFGCKLRLGVEAMPMTFRIERPVTGENAMSELLDLVLRAHGGLNRWNNFNKVSAKFVAKGGLLPMKGLEADPNLSTERSRSMRKVQSSDLLDNPIGE